MISYVALAGSPIAAEGLLGNDARLETGDGTCAD